MDGLEVRDDLKFPLYSASSFKELLTRYELVETVAKNSSVKKSRKYEKTGEKQQEQHNKQQQQHCFNCGSTEHKRAECKEETKCFKCNGVGHIAKQCRGEKPAVNVVVKENRVKEMKIGTTSMSCLIDTGADVSLMRKEQ